MSLRTEAAVDWQGLVNRFDRPEVLALVLAGSYARDGANPFSDIDLVRFTMTGESTLPDGGSHLIAGRLVVVSDVPPEEVDAAFVQPELALSRIPGLRHARALRDRDGFFAALQARAHAFVWDAAMQARADAYADREMVGWIEEVHKGLAGLQRGDIGRLLDAEFGLSWGLNRLVSVQRRIPPMGSHDAVHDWFAPVEAAIGPDTDWVRLRRRVFGVTENEPPPTLIERVIAGLRLYVATAELLEDVWTPESASLIKATVALILATLGQTPALPPNADPMGR